MKFRNSTFYILNFQFPRGDGSSALPDPSFIARAGETNRVTILIGKTYTVSCNMPISCIGKSSADIDVWQNSPMELYICWPVTIEAVGMRSGASFSMSVWPDCLGGSFSWTNSCCSISSSGDVFTYSCNDACHCTGCAAMGYYGYESYRLPAYGGSCGCSSLGNYNEPPGEEDDDDPAGVSVSFSETALFYEEAYTNEPGVVVGRRVSTNVTFSCSVNGGLYGGVLSLSCSGFDKLVYVSGDILPDGTVEIAAEESRTWNAVYAPLGHSSSEGDIMATVTFCEYVSGAVMTNVVQLTVVKLELEPWAVKDGCVNRHLVGVRERVNCNAMPDVGQWGEEGGGYFGSLLGVSYYVCGIIDDDARLYYSVGESHYNFALTITEPVAMLATQLAAYDFGVETNHAGGAGMKLQLYVLPSTVSFDGIAMEEIPTETGIHEGYFANVFFQDVWYHTTNMHAGVWVNVNSDNFYGYDKAVMGDELPREMPNGEMTFDMSSGTWSSGTLIWAINWGWAEKDPMQGATPAKAMPVSYNQTFTFTEEGTLTVSKFMHTVSRGTNNVIRLDGIVQGLDQLEPWGGNNGN